jgi:GntR family transcriptional regulator / MocR family aminotransferase
VAADIKPVSGPGLLLSLDRDSHASLHEQLELRLREHVRGARLAPGTRLPSSRSLAAQLGVSRGVVLEAYAQLIAEGYLTASQGAPTRVATAPSAERPPVPAGSLERRHAYHFDPGLPDLAAFPRDRWLRSIRAALRDAPFDQLGHGDPRGIPELRNELMSYLSHARGAAPEPEHTLICAGFTQGFAVVCRTLRDRGVERIAVEEPGWPRHRLIAERAGLEPIGIPVDEHGISVAALAESGCETVVVTPAHQFPTGVVLAAQRRGALLEWAEDEDALIVEDDYDSELRYDRDPVGALQGLAPERVCSIGSASKRLVPGLRLGWILSPSWLSGALTYEKGVGDGGSPALEQLTLADFIARGELDRHLRRMRLRYRERRAALMQALERRLPAARVTGIAAGLFVAVLLPAGIDEDMALSAAAARGVGGDGLAWHRSARAGPAGIVLGYANLPEPAIAQGVRLLAEAVDTHMP